MDVQMRCWDSAQRSEMRYCTSIFWGHSTANDIQEKLLSALQPLPLAKVLLWTVQILMSSSPRRASRSTCNKIARFSVWTCALAGFTRCATQCIGQELQRLSYLDCLLSSLNALFEDSPWWRGDFSAAASSQYT